MKKIATDDYAARVKDLAKLSPEQIEKIASDALALKNKETSKEQEDQEKLLLKKLPRKIMSGLIRSINKLMKPQEVTTTITLKLDVSANLFWELALDEAMFDGALYDHKDSCGIDDWTLQLVEESIDDKLYDLEFFNDKRKVLQNKIGEILEQLKELEIQHGLSHNAIWNHLVELGKI